MRVRSLFACAVLAICGCSAQDRSLPAIASEAAAPQVAAKLPPLVYATDFYNGDVFAYRSSGSHKQPVETIRGLGPSIGLFVDEHRNLYVSQQGSVIEYTSAGKKLRTYDDSGHDPGGVAKCPNGKLYVANSEGDTISVYARGATRPTGTLDDYGAQVFHVACDRKDDVFVTVGGKSGQVDEFPAGSKQPVNLPISLNFPEGIQVDTVGDVAVANSASIDFYHVGSSKPFESIEVPGGALELSFERGDRQVWETNGSGLKRYSVGGGKLTRTIPGSGFGGLAASPRD